MTPSSWTLFDGRLRSGKAVPLKPKGLVVEEETNLSRAFVAYADSANARLLPAIKPKGKIARGSAAMTALNLDPRWPRLTPSWRR
ncbi:MAG TPA: hypothetical protein VFB82_21420 [Blastocatellia bacterium]|nr:hypothetical protein [Blastocatellia bacterium]